MSSKTLQLNEHLHKYLLSVSVREHKTLQQLRQYTATIRHGGMQISPEQGQLLGMLVQLTAARRVLELGVFTGYSSLAVALALPADGQIIACDVSEEWTTRARQAWRDAGVEEKIDLRLAPALETLDKLLADGEHNSFDFAFVDADKTNYIHYYERLFELIRPGGLIAFDNTLWSGRVADDDDDSEDTEAIRGLNQRLHEDSRINQCLIPIGDGLHLAFKHA